MYTLPDWSQNLINYYVVIRCCRRGSALQRAYYRLAQKEQFRLAESGINQQKIKAVRRFLASRDCVRNYQSAYKDNLIAKIGKSESQFELF